MHTATLHGLLNELEKIADLQESAAGSGSNLPAGSHERALAIDDFVARNSPAAKKKAALELEAKTKAHPSPKPGPPIATAEEVAHTSVRAPRKRAPAPIPHGPPPGAVAAHVPGAPHVSPGAMHQARGFLGRRPGLAMGAVGAAGLIGGAGLMAMAHRRRQQA